MPDRKKVIKGLEHCTAWAGLHECQPKFGPDCPYEDDADCKLALMRDALAALKEQETVKPKKIKGYNPPMYTLYEYKCEKCESPMMNKQPFCMGCGRAVKWND